MEPIRNARAIELMEMIAEKVAYKKANVEVEKDETGFRPVYHGRVLPLRFSIVCDDPGKGYFLKVETDDLPAYGALRDAETEFADDDLNFYHAPSIEHALTYFSRGCNLVVAYYIMTLKRLGFPNN